MKAKVQEAINKQINTEIYSAYLYLSMAAYFEVEGLAGFANWMKMQAQEEMFHAMKFYSHLNERGSKVILEAIAKPKTEFKSTLYVFEEVLQHEQKVTGSIHSLYELAIVEKDFALQSFLKWFIDEQVEEEATASDLIAKIKLAGEATAGILMLDRELSARTFTPSTQSE